MGKLIVFQGLKEDKIEDKLYTDLMDVIEKYAGKMTVATAVGVIEIVRTDVMNHAKNE